MLILIRKRAYWLWLISLTIAVLDCWHLYSYRLCLVLISKIWYDVITATKKTNYQYTYYTTDARSNSTYHDSYLDDWCLSSWCSIVHIDIYEISDDEKDRVRLNAGWWSWRLLIREVGEKEQWRNRARRRKGRDVDAVLLMLCIDSMIVVVAVIDRR